MNKNICKKKTLAMKNQKMALRKGFGAWKDKNHPELVTTRDTIKFVNSIRNIFVQADK